MTFIQHIDLVRLAVSIVVCFAKEKLEEPLKYQQTALLYNTQHICCFNKQSPDLCDWLRNMVT